MIVFGVRSPLVVDYEITRQRLGAAFRYGVSVSGFPRSTPDLPIVEYDNLGDAERGAITPCAFSPTRRQELVQLANRAGFPLDDALIDPTAILPPGLRIGAGSYINAGVVVGGACVFGDCVLINRSASIGHHCVLEDFVSIGPGAVLSGNVRIGRGSMIGAGAIVQSDVRIGQNVLISAGSVIRKTVPDNALIAGNPGKPLPFRGRASSITLPGGE